MEIRFKKLSDVEHELTVVRSDGSLENRVRDNRSFLRHDLAHLAVEMEVPIRLGYWGSVAKGAALDGMSIRGPDIGTAERLSVMVQGLMRQESEDPAQFYAVLHPLKDGIVTRDIATRICARCRELRGHWRATAFGNTMVLQWPEPPA